LRGRGAGPAMQTQCIKFDTRVKWRSEIPLKLLGSSGADRRIARWFRLSQPGRVLFSG